MAKLLRLFLFLISGTLLFAGISCLGEEVEPGSPGETAGPNGVHTITIREENGRTNVEHVFQTRDSFFGSAGEGRGGDDDGVSQGGIVEDTTVVGADGEDDAVGDEPPQDASQGPLSEEETLPHSENFESEDENGTEGEEAEIVSANSTANNFERANCVCGKPSVKRIVGGVTTTIKEYPWTVQLVFVPEIDPYCGGSIVNELYIVTAAHCTDFLTPSDIGVRAGHTNSQNSGQLYLVEKLIVHQKYRRRDITRHDIALLKLKTPLTFSEAALPICLESRTNYQRNIGVITGWGKVAEKGQASDTLRVASVTLYEFGSCRRISKYRRRDLHSGIICGRRKRTDACQGDSGGPLAVRDKTTEKYSLVGITSYGIGCARPRFPGIYTKVPHYRSWILQNTADATNSCS